MKQAEKMEIITLVEQSELSVKATLKELGLHRSTFYQWYKRYLEKGYEGLVDTPVQRRGFWNQVPPGEKERVVELALDRPDLSCRELAWHIIDQEGWFISESSVYRILKSRGLVTTPAYKLIEAADHFANPTTAIHQLWQTDFTYFKIQGWGWYYLSTVMDGPADDVSIGSTTLVTSCRGNSVRLCKRWMPSVHWRKPCLRRACPKISDHGYLLTTVRPGPDADIVCWSVSKYLKEYFQEQNIHHTRCAPHHPKEPIMPNV